MLCFFLCTSLLFSQARPTTGKPYDAAMKAVNVENIRQQDKFISSDLFEGRGTGQRGGDLAAEYIATQFAIYGLKPGGDNGTYLQKVPLVGLTTLPETKFTLVTAKGEPLTLKFKDDYVANNETLTDRADIDTDIVFVGYGIQAPEYGWDDYKGVDVRGKAVLMFVNEPVSNDEKFFKGRALTYYGRWTYKYEQAARMGAVACILIHRTDLASYGWEVVRNSNSAERSFLRDKNPHVKSAGWIQLEVARKLLADSGIDVDQAFKDAQSRDFHPRALGAKLQAAILSKVRDVQSSNVIGILPGSDPKLKDEAVIFSAHHDHLGIRADMTGDNIFNGAADNATGTAMVLEMARAIASQPKRPKRTLIFATVTAEEQGLRGSEFLGRNPPFPAGKITLGLNFDGIAPIGIPEETVLVGAERNTFFPVVQSTAKAFGLTIKGDPHPEAGHYYRSDHFSFSRVGIPSFSVNPGEKWQGHPLEWGQAQSKDYNEHRYHQPSDEYSPDMIFDGNAKLARFGIALAWQAADAPRLIEWHPGDEFEAARKASRK
ncbi:MAG: M28 family peptidase [Acidobacteriales bacterium]|nr:M28 family peptidase [Terriglobales bacterium]